MRAWEKWLLAIGLWVFLAAVINALDGHWSPSLICAMLASSIMVTLFGRAKDRRWNAAQKESAALLARLNRDMADEAQGTEYTRTKEGFYVRKDDVGTDFGSGG